MEKLCGEGRFANGPNSLPLSAQEEQLDAILSTAVETSSLGLITGCIKQWTAEGETPQHTPTHC